MEIRQIPLSLVSPSPMNPRKTFDENELLELADNIEKQGLLQPITVRPIKDARQFAVMDGRADFHPKYEIVCGERRYRAFCKLSDKWAEMDVVAPKGSTYNRFSEISAIVREMSDDEAFDAMITENLQRKDVDPIEEAFAFGQLIRKGKTAEEVAARFGKSIRFVQDRVKLNNLIPELMLAVKEERMSISAAMIIAKLDEEHQKRYHTSYSNNSSGFTRQTAESFTQSLFMSIENSPWYQTDDQNDEDFEGGCDRKCSECQFNTANAGCLFWEMKTNDAGKCTNREMFYKKHVAFLLKSLESYKSNLVAVGQPLESGKIVIVETEEYCAPASVQLKEAVYGAVRNAGYEIIKSGEIFEGKCWYDDERLDRNIRMGNVYHCLRLFRYDRMCIEEEWWYFKGKSNLSEESSQKTSETSTLSVDAMKLMQKRNRLKEAAVEKIAAESRKMADNLGEAKRKGELSDAEMLAFQIIIFTQGGRAMLERYGHKGFGKPSDRSFIGIVKQNRADWAMWVREYIRNIISSADINYNGLYQYCAGLVLEEWMPNEWHELMHKLNEKLGKDLSRNAEKLNELGYDTDGKLLPKEKSEAPISGKRGFEKQYEEMKKKHPDAILLFRIGDFYECFNEDAEEASKILSLTLTTSKGTKLAGFPHHALDTYLPRLTRAGKRVAICEQLEDPKK